MFIFYVYQQINEAAGPRSLPETLGEGPLLETETELIAR